MYKKIISNDKTPPTEPSNNTLYFLDITNLVLFFYTFDAFDLSMRKNRGKRNFLFYNKNSAVLGWMNSCVTKDNFHKRFSFVFASYFEVKAIISSWRYEYTYKCVCAGITIVWATARKTKAQLIFLYVESMEFCSFRL